MSDFIDLTGMQIYEWEVLKYLGHGRWLCKCSCGIERDVDGHELRRGGTKSCGHTRLSEKNLENKEFGDWTVIQKDTTKDRHWICRCKCGCVQSVHAFSLLHGRSKSCGHNSGKLKDMTGMRFGEWYVESYVGNHRWKCVCSCGTRKEILGESLRSGDTKSCGCKRGENTLRSKIEIHGDYDYKNIRELWQISTITDKNRLEQFIRDMIKDKGRLVSNKEIADELGVTRTAIYEATKKFDIEDYKLDKFHSIRIQQSEVYDYILKIYNGEIIANSRKIIPPRELDIYIPELKIAIEYNGDYWHSYPRKSREYHQEKTLACAKQGIRLIHIFEHEWLDSTKRIKIKSLLINSLYNKIRRVYARNTHIKVIDTIVANEFINKYHLQSAINYGTSVGCFLGDELLGVISFGKPRFNYQYEYELLRLCWKTRVNVIGGSEKLFKYICKNFNITSLVTYADISKFTGNVYTKLGFKLHKDAITKPNYIWVSYDKSTVTRYKSQKHKLVQLGIANEDDTEDSIMDRLGYLKVYDSGNLKLEYFKQEA